MFVCAFPACLWLVYCVGWNNYHVDGVTVKKIYFLFVCLTIVTLACWAQAQPPSQLGSVNIEPTTYTSPVKVVITEPTEAAPVYMTTGALNVRAEANADSEILGTLEPFTEVTVFILDVTGDDCYMGEWYAISSPIEGYVCSLWVVRK